MKKISIFLILLVGFLNTSCIEIIDDLLIHDDGSGILKYTINLSSSKVKVNSYLALDSVQGQRVPRFQKSRKRLQRLKNTYPLKKAYQMLLLRKTTPILFLNFHVAFHHLRHYKLPYKQVSRTWQKIKRLQNQAQNG